MIDLQWEKIRISRAIEELNGVIQAAQALKSNMPDGSAVDGFKYCIGDMLGHTNQILDQATVARKYLLRVRDALPLKEKEMQTETLGMGL
jgi:hypothetical protein